MLLGLKPSSRLERPAPGPGRTDFAKSQASAGRSRKPGRRRNRLPAAPFACAVLALLFLAAQPATVALSAVTPSPAPPDNRPVLSVGISPVVTALDLRAGETATLTAVFSSGGTESFQAQVSLRDGLRGPQGFQFAGPGKEFWSAGNWLTVEPVEFHMGPNESRELTAKLTVPETTPDGEYYAAFTVKAVPDPPPGGPVGTTLSFAGSVGSLVCVAVGQNLERAAVLIPYGDVPLGLSPNQSLWTRLAAKVKHWWLGLVINKRNVAIVAEGQPLTAFAPLRNPGKVHIQPRVTATFRKGKTVLGRIVASGEIILPGEKKIVETPWVDSPLYGTCALDLEVEYGGPEPIRVSRTFLILPVKGILGLAVLAFGLGYLVASRGKRKAAPRPPSAQLPV